MIGNITRSLLLQHIAPDLYRTAQGRASAKALLNQRVDHAYMALVHIGVPCLLSYLSFKCAMVVYNSDLSCCAQFFTGNISKSSCLLENAKVIAAAFTGWFLALGVINPGGDSAKEGRNEWIERTVYHLKGIWDPQITARIDCDKLVASFKKIFTGLAVLGLYATLFSFTAFWIGSSML